MSAKVTVTAPCAGNGADHLKSRVGLDLDSQVQLDGEKKEKNEVGEKDLGCSSFFGKKNIHFFLFSEVYLDLLLTSLLSLSPSFSFSTHEYKKK